MQRNSLRPFLFLIYNESLSTLTRVAIKDGTRLRVRVSYNGPKITYLFTVDCILYEEAILESTNVLRAILDKNGAMSDQCVNFQNSSLLVKIPLMRKCKYQLILGRQFLLTQKSI